METNTNPAVVGTEAAISQSEDEPAKNSTSTEEVLQFQEVPKWPREAYDLIQRYHDTRRELAGGKHSDGYSLVEHREEFLNEIVGLLAKYPQITQTLLLRAEAGQRAIDEEKAMLDERIGRKRKK